MAKNQENVESNLVELPQPSVEIKEESLAVQVTRVVVVNVVAFLAGKMAGRVFDNFVNSRNKPEPLSDL